ncbi:MAG: J domain-containing protein [Planctomycetota bacterium]|nr:J domain-containing protein [Planctomycetota bacterium]
MEIGRCPRCQTAYTASEVTGFGVLRARAAHQGGPRMEYACQGCGRIIQLIPHGESRYAPPGEPPVAVPPSERAPPWMRERPPESSGPESSGHGPPPPAREPDPSPPEPPLPTPISLSQALAVLGVDPTATRADLERAFRDRSRTCHPDKVAHLDIEFQQLAERKFLRLQQAYDLLMSVTAAE